MSSTRREFLAGSAAAASLLASGHLVSAEEPDTLEGNPYLVDNFAPVREEVTLENLKVAGQLPADLNGMFVRNGPNPQFRPKLNYHWFDGDGMLHGIHLGEGKASYRNRWVRTEAWLEENRAGRAVHASFLDPLDPRELTRRILAGKLPFANRANTAVIWHHGKLLALWEGGEPYEVRLPRLDTVGPYSFDGRLKHPFTAHPKVDPRTGELIFFGYWPFSPLLQYSVANREGVITHTTRIELPRPVMIHDVAVTKNHTVFLDTPATFDGTAALQGKPLLRWRPNLPARMGVIPRHGGGDEIKWFPIETCFVFHVYNAYEDGDELSLLACRFNEYPKFVDVKPGSVTTGNFDQLVNASHPVTYRWRLNLKTGAISEQAVDDLMTELPRVDERRTGRKTRYGYAVTGNSRTGALVKYDFEAETSSRHELGNDRLAGEGIFVPRQGATGEDDGYLLSLAYDRSSQTSELLVLDASDLSRQPLARVYLPQRVPHGFHGTWIPCTATS